jgi:hypothetical protein
MHMESKKGEGGAWAHSQAQFSLVTKLDEAFIREL